MIRRTDRETQPRLDRRRVNLFPAIQFVKALKA